MNKDNSLNFIDDFSDKLINFEDFLDFQKIKNSNDITPTISGEYDIARVIGQDHLKELAPSLLKFKKSLLMIGDPGVGKSLFAKCIAQNLPKIDIEGVRIFRNSENPINPILEYYSEEKEIFENPFILKKKKGKQKESLEELEKSRVTLQQFFLIFGIIGFGTGLYLESSLLVFFSFLFFQIFLFYYIGENKINKITSFSLLRFVDEFTKREKLGEEIKKPYVVLRKPEKQGFVPFVRAVSNSRTLMGYVQHDPWGGEYTRKYHERVILGSIHKAHQGFLYFDEIGTLSYGLQVRLLEVIEDKYSSITGYGTSAGVVVSKVKADFAVIFSGNLETTERLHIALRSRIKKEGYEIFMNKEIKDTHENRLQFLNFLRNELFLYNLKNKKNLSFSKDFLVSIFYVAKEMSSDRNQISLRLREVSGYILSSIETCITAEEKEVTSEHLLKIKEFKISVEKKVLLDRVKEVRKYWIYSTEGYSIGMVNCIAIFSLENSSEFVGFVTRLICRSVPSKVRSVIIQNFSSDLFKELKELAQYYLTKIFPKKKEEIFLKMESLGTKVDGNSANLMAVVAMISEISNIPCDLSFSGTGSLDYSFNLTPIGGVFEKVKGAKFYNITKIIIPKNNYLTSFKAEKKIKVFPCSKLSEVLQLILKKGKKKDDLIQNVIFLESND